MFCYVKCQIFVGNCSLFLAYIVFHIIKNRNTYFVTVILILVYANCLISITTFYEKVKKYSYYLN